MNLYKSWTQKSIFYSKLEFSKILALLIKLSLKIALTALFLFDVDGGVTMFAE